jgi:hypothetical protein
MLVHCRNGVMQSNGTNWRFMVFGEALGVLVLTNTSR